MKATREFCKMVFDEYNKSIFGGVLPNMPIICVAPSDKNNLGLYVWRSNGTMCIHISIRHEFSERALRNVIAHEMLHAYINVKCIRDNNSHGRVFCSMADAINAKHGLNIDHGINSDKEIKRLF